MEGQNKAGTAPMPDGTLIDTKALNEALVSFYDGLAQILTVMSNAAAEINKVGQRVVAMTEGTNQMETAYTGASHYGKAPNATDPDYCIPDEVDEAKGTTEAYEPMQNEDKPMPVAPATDKPAPEKPKEAKPAPEASEAPAAKSQPPVSSITLDDITKVIVTKIKQDRKNNEAIGKLVSAYGYRQVREIPPEKFEAFLNDLAQL